MIKVSIGGVLIGILLIALIVLVVFLIVMVSNLTDTIKKANAILDGSMAAADSARKKVEDVNASVKETVDKFSNAAGTGINAVTSAVGGVVDKITK